MRAGSLFCVAVLFCLFFSSCQSTGTETFTSKPGRTMDLIGHKFKSPCFEVQGIKVFKFEVEFCPSHVEVETLVLDLYDRLEVEDPLILEGLEVVFVPTLLICGDKGDDEWEIVWGCTRFEDPIKSTVFLSGDRFFWGQVFCHELAHSLDVLLFGGDGDGDHEKRGFWDKAEDIGPNRSVFPRWLN